MLVGLQHENLSQLDPTGVASVGVRKSAKVGDKDRLPSWGGGRTREHGPRLVVSLLGQGTYLNLEYALNLDPDSRERQRGYNNLADHGRLSLWYAQQPSGSFAEVRGESLVVAVPLDGEGYAHVGGLNLDTILAGAGDVEVLLLDAQHSVLRREHIGRTALQEADSSMRRLSRDIQWRLRDPASRCAPLERIILE